ncbi:hypothetical protein OG216_35045 [Streptomycetaceae bacterium NBC_01309]
MTGLFLPDGTYREAPVLNAPQVEWRRLAGLEPYRITVDSNPVRVVLTQRYVDENGTVRKQVQQFREVHEMVIAIAMNDFVAAVRGRIAADLSDVALALGLPEADLDRAVELISRQMHGTADDRRFPRDAGPRSRSVDG